MKRALSIALVVSLLFGFGCAGMSDSQQRTMSGGAIGAAAGAGVTAIAGGNALVGGAVGAAAGALTGYIVGETKKKKVGEK